MISMKSCVLLAAHETEILRTLPLILQAAGHRVQLADCGLDALNKARRSSPSVIILDAILPDMEGTTACDILRLLPSTARVPRILLTARTSLFSPAALHSRPSAHDPIPPFNSEEIINRVNQALGLKPEHDLVAVADEDAA